VSWLPPEPHPDSSLHEAEPWRPPPLADVAFVEVADMSYAVLEEIVGDAAELQASDWPVLDELGRLRFPTADHQRTVTVDLASFHALVVAARAFLAGPQPQTTRSQRTSRTQTGVTPRVEQLAERALAVGDVFAVRPLRHRAVWGVLVHEVPRVFDPGANPPPWLKQLFIPPKRAAGRRDQWPPLFDVTADAREAAKIANSAAGNPPLGEREIEAIAKQILKDDEGEPGDAPEHP
jgi:hypothetical protein